jgi:hypothetical protein
MTESPKLIISTLDRVMQRSISDESDIANGCNTWKVSSPIPGTRIVNTWEIYHGIMLALSITEGGHYCLYRSAGRAKYTLVHEHTSKIFGLFYIDDGHVIFSAADGWYTTEDTGLTWTLFSSVSGDGAPVARAAVITGSLGDHRKIIAYGEDHKLYRCSYPGGVWEMVLDTTTLTSEKWYPALSGAPVGFLAGAGNKLLRSSNLGSSGSWSTIQEVSGIIKRIVASNRSNLPTFMIEVETISGESSIIYWTYDMGDSIVPDLNRVSPIASVQSVVPTGGSEIQTMFVVLGKRTSEGEQNYKIIQE